MLHIPASAASSVKWERSSTHRLCLASSKADFLEVESILPQAGVADGSQSLDWSLLSPGTGGDLYQEWGRLCSQNNEAPDPGFTISHLCDLGQVPPQSWSTALWQAKDPVSRRSKLPENSDSCCEGKIKGGLMDKDCRGHLLGGLASELRPEWQVITWCEE